MGQYCPLLVVFSSAHSQQQGNLQLRIRAESKTQFEADLFTLPSMLSVASTPLHKSRFDQEEEDDPSKQEDWRLIRSLPSL